MSACKNRLSWFMDQQETQFRALYGQFLTWQQSQQGQTDGYAFEQSFETFTHQLNHHLLALTLQADKPQIQEPKKK